MKKELLALLISILSFNSFAQISFEKGYYLDNSGQKIDCLIKNVDWRNNPTEFWYKLSENEPSNVATINSVKEFGIYNSSKYNRFTVNIDRSSEFIRYMSKIKSPEFKEEQLFLKVLIEGKANLYVYEDGNLTRFFYATNSINIEQLIFKSYRTDDNELGKNNRYWQQLWSNLKCDNISTKSIEKIRYKQNELVNFFTKYNECSNSEFTNFEKKKEKHLFNLNIRPGINSSSLSIHNSVASSLQRDFDSELSLRLGVEAEFIMPFNKNKWAIIIEPTYQYYKSEIKSNSQTQRVTVDYSSIELSIGLRHYFFLNSNSKIFINGSLIFDFSAKSKIDFETAIDLDVKTRYNGAFGFGYNYMNKYSLEFRYGFGREILANYTSWNSDYKSLSLIFGYTIF